MVNKIIADYLKTNKRLIVPQFGAFLHKDDGTVAFVPFLKKDDGVLIQLIGSASRNLPPKSKRTSPRAALIL